MSHDPRPLTDNPERDENKQSLRTDHGVIHSQWEDSSPLTTMGYLTYFAQFLHAGQLFSAWCSDCPLEYTSNNAPKIDDVLGTGLLSVLAGHCRYSHASSLYGDDAAAEILGIGKIVSHDSLSRALGKIDAASGRMWMQNHLVRTYEPLLREPYVLDLDPTVKPVYGHQEGACKGYNPTKPGRPSLCYHTYFVGNLRLVLDVDVRPGNETAGKYSHEGLWSLLDRLPHGALPSFIRGDIAFGNESTIRGCEEHDVRYLFKLRQSPRVKGLLETLLQPGTQWLDHGDGWSSFETRLRLQGWTRSRRVVVCRRQRQQSDHPNTTAKHRQPKLLPPAAGNAQPELFEILEPAGNEPDYEWSVLVTDLDYEAPAVAQLYRDRADCENVLDELKNQWGWGGFTSRELKRTQLMAQIVAMVYNWWNIFARLAKSNQHLEAVTSRPLLQCIVGRLVKSGRQRLVRLCATGEKAAWARQAFEHIADFINALQNATQLTDVERWCRILSKAFREFLREKIVKPIADGPQLLLGV